MSKDNDKDKSAKDFLYAGVDPEVASNFFENDILSDIQTRTMPRDERPTIGDSILNYGYEAYKKNVLNPAIDSISPFKFPEEGLQEIDYQGVLDYVKNIKLKEADEVSPYSFATTFGAKVLSNKAKDIDARNARMNAKIEEGIDYGQQIHVPIIDALKKSYKEGSFRPFTNALTKSSGAPLGNRPYGMSDVLMVGAFKLKDLLAPEVLSATEASSFIEDSLVLQGKLGFADTEEEYMKALRAHVTKKNGGFDREIKITKDDEAGVFEPKYYVQIEKDDGTFTKASNPLQTTYDFMARASGQLGFDIAAGSVDMLAASQSARVAQGATKALVGKIPIVGQIVPKLMGAAAFMYVAYSSGVAYEEVRNKYLKKYLGLTDEEADVFESMIKVGTAPVRGDLSDEEILSARVTAGANVFGTVIDKVIQAGTSLRTLREGGLDDVDDATLEKLQADLAGMQENIAIGQSRKIPFIGKGNTENPYISGNYNMDVYPQMVIASQKKELTKPGGELDLGVDLGTFLLHQYTPSPILNRFAMFTSQTNPIIPGAMKLLSRKLVNYSKQFLKQELISFDDYRQFKDVYKQLDSVYRTMSKEGKNSFDRMAKKLGALDETFAMLRAYDAKLKYNVVFDAIGNASYDLTGLRTKLIKTMFEGEGQIPKSGMELKDTPLKDIKASKKNIFKSEGSYTLNQIRDDLLELGGVTGKGTTRKRTLTVNQMRAATEQFKEKYVDFLPKDSELFKMSNVQTPAELLHQYAILLGRVAYKKYADVGVKEGNKVLFDQAISMRNDILDLLSNPIVGKADGVKAEDVGQIKTLMGEANDFYKETLRLRGKIEEGQTFQRELISALKRGDSSILLNKLLTTPTRGFGVEQLRNIDAQVKYLNKKLFDAGPKLKVRVDGKEFEGATLEAGSLDDLLGQNGLSRLRTKLSKFNIQEDMFDDVTGNLSNTYQDLQLDFSAQLYLKLANQTGVFPGRKKDDVGISEFLESLDDDQLSLLGIDNTTKNYFIDTSNDLASIFDNTFVNQVREISAKGRLFDVVKDVFDKGDMDTGLSRLLLDKEFRTADGKTIPLNESVMIKDNPFEQAQRKEMLRTAILNWMFDPRDGGGNVFKRINKNTPLADAGTEIIDAGKLDLLMERLQGSEMAKKILTERDFAILDVIRQVGFGLAGSATDAGTALSGAQIIGELFTIDGRKLIGGLARIRAQKGIANFFTNEKVINLMTKMSDVPYKQKGYYQQILFGYGALSDMAAKIYQDNKVEESEIEEDTLEGTQPSFEQFEIGSLNEQTNRLLN